MHRSASDAALAQHPADKQNSIAPIAEAINRVDAGLTGLQELLDCATGTVSAEGIAALLRPHTEALRRASAELNDIL